MEKEKKYYWTIPVVQKGTHSSMTTDYGHVATYEEALKLKSRIIKLYEVVDPKAEVQDPIKQEEYTRLIDGKFVYGICDADKID